jgi:hypothetical protein
LSAQERKLEKAQRLKNAAPYNRAQLVFETQSPHVFLVIPNLFYSQIICKSDAKDILLGPVVPLRYCNADALSEMIATIQLHN